MDTTERFSRMGQIAWLLQHIAYKDWEFCLHIKADHAYLQLEWYSPDNDTGERSLQKSRKWLISPHMTDAEVVQTAFLAVKTAEEHEIRELFTYSGARIFGPHKSLRTLMESTLAAEDHRPEPVGK